MVTVEQQISNINWPGVKFEKADSVDLDGFVVIAEPYQTMVKIYSVFGLAAAATGAYHGYRRNESVGWAVGWFLLGSIFPFVSVPVMLAQGFGKRRTLDGLGSVIGADYGDKIRWSATDGEYEGEAHNWNDDGNTLGARVTKRNGKKFRTCECVAVTSDMDSSILEGGYGVSNGSST